MIFLDTPGIHEVPSQNVAPGEAKNTPAPKSIHERINAEAFAALREADVIVRLIDPTRPPGTEDARIDEVLSHSKKPILRVATKQGLIPEGSHQTDASILRVDSLTRVGLDELLAAIEEHLPEGPYLYESDYYTIQTVEFRIAETIREQLFAQLGEELPYASYVEVDQVEHTDRLLKIQAYISVESESQKTIVIGKGGKKIQSIGTEARQVLEGIFGKKVFLALRVKVHKNWRKDVRTLEKLFPKR